MITKAISTDPQLKQCQCDYVKSVRALSKFNPQRYNEANQNEIIILAQEIKYNNGAQHSDSIKRATGIIQIQTIYYVQDGAFIKGLISCVSQRSMCTSPNKDDFNFCGYCNTDKCYKVQITQLSGIIAGGEFLLNAVVSEAFVKGFNAVYLTPAVNGVFYTKEKLIEYYQKIGNKYHWGFQVKSGDCYCYRQKYNY